MIRESSTSSSQKGKEKEKEEHRDKQKAVEHKCCNPACYAPAREVELKACARCKTTRYCSRECQAAHWKSHKPWCNNNTGHAGQLAIADACGFNKGLPSGLTLLELDKKLEKWVKFHSHLLLAATIHALLLPTDIKRSHTHILRVQVSYRADNGGVNARAFRVDNAFPVEIAAARALGGVWPESLDHIQRMREESEALKRGGMTAVALECYPLAMQIVPFGSLRNLSALKIQQRWKDILIKNVEAGKKLTQFE